MTLTGVPKDRTAELHEQLLDAYHAMWDAVWTIAEEGVISRSYADAYLRWNENYVKDMRRKAQRRTNGKW